MSLAARRASGAASAADDGRKRYFDPRFNATAVRVFPGEHYVSDDASEMIVTILGSCVSACIRDPATGYAGMNHFMLPESETGEWGAASAAMRYGNYAMEVLINDLMRRGGQRDRLEIKLFGGGSIGRSNSTVGQQNAEFVVDYLKAEGLAIVAADLGGQSARRIHYFPGTGKVKRLALQSLDSTRLRAEESAYTKTLAATEAASDDIELFD